jgi:large subunit ribosomal protein L13
MDYVIDAARIPLGRLASEVATILQGKRDPHYHPRLPGTSKVVVQNISKVALTGNKPEAKIYYRHTGYMGHLRKKTYEQIFDARPEEVLYRAVYHMLPKNRLRKGRLKRLVIQK